MKPTSGAEDPEAPSTTTTTTTIFEHNRILRVEQIVPRQSTTATTTTEAAVNSVQPTELSVEKDSEEKSQDSSEGSSRPRRTTATANGVTDATADAGAAFRGPRNRCDAVTRCAPHRWAMSPRLTSPFRTALWSPFGTGEGQVEDEP